MVTGPRKVVRNVTQGENTVLKYRSHMVAELATLGGEAPQLATARFAIVGAPNPKNGQPYVTTYTGTTNKYGRSSTPLVAAPSDADLSGLFEVPQPIEDAIPTHEAWPGEQLSLIHI